MARKSVDHIQLALEYGIDIPGRAIYMTSLTDGASGDEAGIDWQMADRILKGLQLLGSGDQPVKLIINSFGGEDDHARAIIGAIRQCRVPVHGVVFGRAESAAAWILQHCHRRSLDRCSNLMLHMGSSDKTKHSQYVDNVFIEDILNRLREKDHATSKSKLIRQLHEDWYIYPTQAVALGLADEVLE
jgi:ATP-dependent protease ClpP protease subunit